jgi:hypothetical protein
MATKNPFWSILLSVCLTTAPWSLDGCRNAEKVQAQSSQSQQAQEGQQAPATTYATPTADELYRLVAPIALFPDNLVAQVLAASTYPDQITAAHAWLQQNSTLTGDKLTQAVDQQPWDASVKGLTQFADVLNQMATNLSWTSALGDAYFNIPQNVMNAVQVMRQRAQTAGNLKTTQQQKVTVENQAPAPTDSSQPVIVQAPPQTIIIQPAQPQVVYVPAYNPTLVYGAPVAVYPGYSTAGVVATSMISFGVGMAVGAAISGGWGWNSWGCGWRNSTVIYNRNVYVSRSNTFVNRNNYYGRNVNNINVNNVNRNNLTRNNVNNNYRSNNFNNTARNSNITTPNFNQKYNQPQYSSRGNPAQINGQQFKGSNPSGFNQQNRATPDLNQGRATNLGQTQRENARGYGQQPDRGTSRGAFSSYGQGGNAMANGARGQQSLEAANRAGASRQPRATGARRR